MPSLLLPAYSESFDGAAGEEQDEEEEERKKHKQRENYIKRPLPPAPFLRRFCVH